MAEIVERGALDTLQAAFERNHAPNADRYLWSVEFIWDKLRAEIQQRGETYWCGICYRLSAGDNHSAWRPGKQLSLI